MTRQALATRLDRIEAARRAERDALVWPALLAAWRAGADTFNFAGGVAWREMVGRRRAEVDQTLLDYDDENTVNPS